MFNSYENYSFLEKTKAEKKILDTTIQNIMNNEDYTYYAADFRSICDPSLEIKRQHAIAARLISKGKIKIQEKVFTVEEILRIYLKSYEKMGKTYYPLSIKISEHPKLIYWFVKYKNGYYLSPQVGYIKNILPISTLNKAQKNYCLEPALANQTARCWLEIDKIILVKQPILPEQLITISSGESLRDSFNGSQPFIRCI